MISIFLLSMPGGSEWILIVVAFLLLFGAKKIPELMRGLGKGIREFKDAKEKIEEDIVKPAQEPPEPAKANQ